VLRSPVANSESGSTGVEEAAAEADAEAEAEMTEVFAMEPAVV
jgi:hypothetical protein